MLGVDEIENSNNSHAGRRFKSLVGRQIGQGTVDGDDLQGKPLAQASTEHRCINYTGFESESDHHIWYLPWNSIFRKP